MTDITDYERLVETAAEVACDYFKWSRDAGFDPQELCTTIFKKIGLTPESCIVKRSLIEGFLTCPEIADCAPEDLDNETRQLEREARLILSARPQLGERSDGCV